MADRAQRVKGKAEETKGRVKRETGVASGRPGTETRGAGEELKGKARNAVGDSFFLQASSPSLLRSPLQSLLSNTASTEASDQGMKSCTWVNLGSEIFSQVVGFATSAWAVRNAPSME